MLCGIGYASQFLRCLLLSKNYKDEIIVRVLGPRDSKSCLRCVIRLAGWLDTGDVSFSIQGQVVDL